MGQAIESKTTVKEKNSKLSKSGVKKTLDVLRGQKIIGRNEVDGFYYPGNSYVSHYFSKLVIFSIEVMTLLLTCRRSLTINCSDLNCYD